MGLRYEFAMDQSLPDAADEGQIVVLVSALGEVVVPVEFQSIDANKQEPPKKERRHSVWDDPEFRKSRAG